MLTLDIQRETGAASPGDAPLRRAAEQALAVAAVGERDWELSLRLVDCAEMQDLNQRYRDRDRPTNVLSFPAQLPADVDVPLLGDVVICAPLVQREAAQQHKPPAAHWGHLLIHGVLHLLGFDHERCADARRMEAMERQALAALGWPDPYARRAAPQAGAPV